MQTSIDALRRAAIAILANCWGVLLIALAWEAWVRWKDFNAIVIPHPLAVVRDIMDTPALYASNAGQTMALAVGGLAIGLLVGSLLAILTWLSKTLAGLLTPLALIFASVPVVALIPILARLLGYNLKTELAIVAIISFFPSFVFTAAGLRALPAGSTDLFQANGASTWHRLAFLAVPAAVPNWMLALRLAAANSILAAMVAEFLMGTSGLGNLFHAASDELAMPRALGASLIAMTISVILYAVMGNAASFINERWNT